MVETEAGIWGVPLSVPEKHEMSVPKSWENQKTVENGRNGEETVELQRTNGRKGRYPAEVTQ